MWYGYDGEDYEVFVHDGSKLMINTSDPGNDMYPQINDKGQVVWCRCDNNYCKIFLYDINWLNDPNNHPKQISDNLSVSDDLYDLYPHPQINDKTQVVWYGRNDDVEDYEIYFYDPNDTYTVNTDNPYHDLFPRINNDGKIVWCGNDGMDNEIFFCKNYNIHQLSEHYMPTIFAVKDQGGFYTELWTQHVVAFNPDNPTIEASFAKDPRGGFWYFPMETEFLFRLALIDGNISQSIDLKKEIFIDEPGTYWPFSVMTIAEDPNYPIMIVSARRKPSINDDGAAYVLAINLAENEAQKELWRFKISDDTEHFTAGQFPIVIKGEKPRVIFTNNNKGTYCIGAP